MVLLETGMLPTDYSGPTVFIHAFFKLENYDDATLTLIMHLKFLAFLGLEFLC